MVGEIVGVVSGAVLGAGAGAGVRILLARMPRGITLRVGPTEALAGVVTALGLLGSWHSPFAGLVLLAGLLIVALAPIDALRHRLPDAITLPAIVVGAVVVLITELFVPSAGSLIAAVVTASVLWALFALVARISPRSMGRGDVKLIPSLGLLMGYQAHGTAVLGLALAFSLGAVVSLAGMAAGRLQLRSAIPLGPFLLVGCWLALILDASGSGPLR